MCEELTVQGSMPPPRGRRAGGSVLAALALCGLAAAAPQAARAQVTPFLGQIITVPYNFCPQGWIEPLGQTLAINSYTALFSLIGTTYGGNGTSTFQLPYLPPLTVSYNGSSSGSVLLRCMALQGVYPSRG